MRLMVASSRSRPQHGLDVGGSGLAPVDSISRRNAVMREIRRAIVLGNLKPGEKLTEISLAAALAVSRPTVREAMTQLAHEGLLIQEPYRGVRVADVDPDAIIDMARTRVALDLLAVQDILVDPTRARLRRVREAWREHVRLAITGDPVEAFESHIAFHRQLWDASDNTFLIKMWPVMEAHLTIVLARDQMARDNSGRMHVVHGRLVEAVCQGLLALPIESCDTRPRWTGLMAVGHACRRRRER